MSVPQQQRSKETVEQILIAANEEFSNHGFAAATTTSIAERAGASVGSMYRFFSDKRALAEALSERYLQDALVAFTPVVESIRSPGDLVPAVRSLVREAFRLQRIHGGYYRIAQDFHPELTSSPTHGVRVALLDAFDEKLQSILNIDEYPEPYRKRVITMMIETVRHTLATLPAGTKEKDLVVDELEEMMAMYLGHRLGVPLE